MDNIKNILIDEQALSVINSLPIPIYWTNEECKLVGYNYALLKFLKVENTQNLDIEKLYFLIAEKFNLNSKEINNFKLDDMNVIFLNNNIQNVIKSSPRSYFNIKNPLRTEKSNKAVGVVVAFIEELENKADTTNINVDLSEEASNLRGLIIEDNKIAADVTQAIFKKLSCTLDVALTADLGIKLFKKNRYHFILMDIELTDTSGYILAKKIRSLEKNKKTPIIALTSYNANIVQYDCGDYQMNGVITKPLTINQAQSIIEKFAHQKIIEVPGMLEVVS